MCHKSPGSCFHGLQLLALWNMDRDHVQEDGTVGCLACNKYAVLPPRSRHGMRDYQHCLTVSVKQCGNE